MGLRNTDSITLLGYARVSRDDGQDPALQTRTLEAAGVTKVFEERASGGRWDRPELQRMLDQLRPGDVVVVWKLDRLSRSLKDLLRILDKIEQAGAGFRSLTEAVDTTTAAGRMLMQMLGSFAEFEREMIRERTRAGLAAARAQGRIGGRRPKLDQAQQKEVVDMVTSGRKTAAEVARLFGVHPSTVGRIVARAPITLNPLKTQAATRGRSTRRRVHDLVGATRGGRDVTAPMEAAGQGYPPGALHTEAVREEAQALRVPARAPTRDLRRVARART